MLHQGEDMSMTAGPVVFNAKIRNRILVRILAAASLVLVVMGLVLYLLTRQLLHAEITAKSEGMVALVAASMERWLVEKSAALAALVDVEAQYTAPHPAQLASFTLVGHQIGDPPGVYMGYEDGPFVSAKTGGISLRTMTITSGHDTRTLWPRITSFLPRPTSTPGRSG
jgi:hypothetical protein